MTKDFIAFLKLVITLCVMTSFCAVLGAQTPTADTSSLARDRALVIARLITSAGYQLSAKDLPVLQTFEKPEVLVAEGELQDYEQIINEIIRRLVAAQSDEKPAYGATLKQALSLVKATSPDGYAKSGQVLEKVANYCFGYEYNLQAGYCFREAAFIHLASRKFDDACWSFLNYGEALKRTNNFADAKATFSYVTGLLRTVTLLPDYYLKDQLEWRQLKGYKFKLSGEIQNAEGNYRKAIQNTEIALRLERNGQENEELGATTKGYVANYHSSLGMYYYNIGDFERSHLHFAQVQDLDADFLLQPDNNWLLSLLALKKKEYAAAQNYLDACLEQLESRKGAERLKIKALTSMSTLFQESGEYAKASYYSLQATALKVAAAKHYAWSSLGASYVKQGKYAEALEALERARQAFHTDKAASSGSLGFLSEIYRLTGEAHLENGDPVSALTAYQQALIANHWDFKDSTDLTHNPSLTGVKDPVYFIKALSGKANALTRMPDNAEYNHAGIETFSLAIQWMDSLRTSYSSEASMLDWSSFFKRIYEDAIAASFDSYQRTGKEGYLDRAFVFAEKSKNAILLEQIQALKGKSYAGIPREDLEREKDLQIDLAYYDRELRALGPDGAAAERSRFQTFQAQTKLELVELQEDLERDYPRYRDIKYGNETPDLAQVRNSLLNGTTALVSYFIGRERAFAIIISRTKAAMVELAAPEQVNLKTKDFVFELLKVDSLLQDFIGAFATYNAKGVDLYETVFWPVEQQLPPKIDRLLIIPDASLNGLPFAALPTLRLEQPNRDFGQQPYLLHKYQTQYAYSAALQIRSKERANVLVNSESCLAYAPPYLKMDGYRSPKARATFPAPLEGTAREIRQISRHITGTFDSTRSATKANFLALAGNYGILHLAMHGVADPQDPNGNHLVFTNFGATVDSVVDNRLYHYEIANLDLNAQLVVLSACETGVGKYEDGEGVYSLARSFSYAGVPSVVMSLWKASDFGTSEIMPSFYEQLANGATKDRSLQQAKITYLKKVDPQYRHPYYWAAFVGLGEAQPITVTPFSKLAWMGGLAMVLLLVGSWGWRAYKLSKA